MNRKGFGQEGSVAKGVGALGERCSASATHTPPPGLETSLGFRVGNPGEGGWGLPFPARASNFSPIGGAVPDRPDEHSNLQQEVNGGR